MLTHQTDTTNIIMEAIINKLKTRGAIHRASSWTEYRQLTDQLRGMEYIATDGRVLYFEVSHYESQIFPPTRNNNVG